MASAGDQWSAAFAAASTEGMRVYDELIATYFRPFALDIVDRLAPPPGCAALDVACGPGTVSRVLAARIGSAGRVVAADVSAAMLALARAKAPEPGSAPIEWLESGAAPLPVPDAAFDVIACQQGLQFFPDKIAALSEMRRALAPGGRAVASFWTAVEEQPLFRALHDTAAAVISPDLGAQYRGPFSLAGEDAAGAARTAGFEKVTVERVTLPSTFEGGPAELMRTLDASGIAQDFAALDESTKRNFLDDVARRVAPYERDGRLHAPLTGSVLTLA